MNVNRVEKLIINLDTAMPLSCAWDDCPRRARTPYQVRTHEHEGPPGGRICGLVFAGHPDYPGRHSHYAFCSERCKTYWLAASGKRAHQTAHERRGQIYGYLPAGMRGVL